MREHAHGRPATTARPAASVRTPSHVPLSNRAVGRLLARDEKRPSWFMPSSPTIDIYALRNQDAFIKSKRPLFQDEIDLAKTVYGSSLDLTRVRIAVTDVLAAPTTLANTIRVEKDPIDNGTFIHELMHVWQYQTAGIGYVSCALAGQVQGTVAHGDRNWTYEYKPGTAGTKLSDYGPEQQASIIEDAFTKK